MGEDIFIVRCCVCKHIRVEHKGIQVWVAQEDAIMPGHSAVKYSDTYCPDCAKDAVEELELCSASSD